MTSRFPVPNLFKAPRASFRLAPAFPTFPSSFFSQPCKTLPGQPISFDNHTKCPGGGVPNVKIAVLLPHRSAAQSISFLLIRLRTLCTNQLDRKRSISCVFYSFRTLARTIGVWPHPAFHFSVSFFRLSELSKITARSHPQLEWKAYKEQLCL